MTSITDILNRMDRGPEQGCAPVSLPAGGVGGVRAFAVLEGADLDAAADALLQALCSGGVTLFQGESVAFDAGFDAMLARSGRTVVDSAPADPAVWSPAAAEVRRVWFRTPTELVSLIQNRKAGPMALSLWGQDAETTLALADQVGADRVSINLPLAAPPAGVGRSKMPDVAPVPNAPRPEAGWAEVDRAVAAALAAQGGQPDGQVRFENGRMVITRPRPLGVVVLLSPSIQGIEAAVEAGNRVIAPLVKKSALYDQATALAARLPKGRLTVFDAPPSGDLAAAFARHDGVARIVEGQDMPPAWTQDQVIEIATGL